MRWCVIRHPELGAAIVAEGGLPVHEKRGWVRTSPLVDDQYTLNPADHPLPDPDPEPVVVEQSTDAAVDPSGSDTSTATHRPATKTRKSTED